MPNVGRPSDGCKNCRDRKVKCDQKRPSCSQCLRINKACHGYRDPLTMMFKNESDVVAKKAKSRYQELSKQRSQKKPGHAGARSALTSSDTNLSDSGYSSCSSDQVIVPVTKYQTTQAMRLPLAPPLEDQALGFFLSNYVVAPKFIPRGEYDFLYEVLNRPDTPTILQRSVTAAGLAGMANATKSAAVLKKAQQEYVSALNMTNAALRSTETATDDGTLIAVIMLGLYENFAFKNKGSLEAWAQHVSGACVLLNLRGEDQFKSSVGVRILQQYYGTILLAALVTKKPVPKGISELWEKGSERGDYSVQGRDWTVKLVRYLRIAISMANDTTSDTRSLVAKTMKIDRELEETKAMVPNVWKYETIYLEKPLLDVYGNFYHVYLDPWILMMWNNLRTVRLLLHRIIANSLRKGLGQVPPTFSQEEATPQLKLSVQLMHTTTLMICATVPQLNGQIAFPELTAAIKDPAAPFSDRVNLQDPAYKIHPRGTFLKSSRSTCMHHLVHPLYTIGESEVCPQDLRQWIVDELLFVYSQTGTRQALVLAQDLQKLPKLGSVMELQYKHWSCDA